MTNPPIETHEIPTESALISTKNKWRPRLGFALLVAVWLMICYQLSLVWTINAQYSHGWLVPILCLYLAGKSSLPASYVPERESTRSSITLWLLGGISLLLIFPAWIIREANSDWRLINVILVGLAMTLTFAMIHHEGGWPKAKVLIFAIMFFLVAVPWPLATDLQLTLWLQGKVSGIIVDALLLLGYQVELEGHVIHVPPFGHVGVDEACSGIRGLQASIVVSLFIGQYYRFSILHRFLFCFIGLALALMANMGRAFVLALYATRGKIDMVNEWHNSAGLIETGCILVGLLVCSQLIKNKSSSHVLGETNFAWTSLKTAPPLPFSIAGLTVIATTLVASFLHYFLNERDMNPIPPLKIDFTTGDVVSEDSQPSQQIEAQLHYEKAQSTKWQDLRYARKMQDGSFQINSSGEYWQGFACSWESGGACTAVLSTHSPDACLPLTGLRKISPAHGQPPETATIEVGKYKVPFESYLFEKDGNRLYVFRCFWPHKARGESFPPFPQGGYDLVSRVRSAWRGERNVGGTMIALCVGNVFDMATAKRKLAEQVRRHISPES